MEILLILGLVALAGFFIYRTIKKRKAKPGNFLVRLVKRGGDQLVRFGSREHFLDWYRSHPEDDPVWDTPLWKGVEKIEALEDKGKALTYL